MDLKDLLVKIEVSADDTILILDADSAFGNEIDLISKEYMQQEDRTERKSFLEQARALSDNTSEYMLYLLFWLHCALMLKKEYEQLGIPEDIYIDSMKDIAYKIRECKAVKGVCGVFVDWFCCFFNLKTFGLGRLEYEIVCAHEDYTFGGYTLKAGDRAYNCHIPSAGKLTQELVEDSLHKAYQFFKKDLPGTILPVVCHSWLLYPAYLNGVFPKNSNLARFAQNFDVIKADHNSEFHDCWRVFYKMYEDRATGLPAQTTLQRNFIKYMEDGGSFGAGFGVLLYDGKLKKIINL